MFPLFLRISLPLPKLKWFGLAGDSKTRNLPRFAMRLPYIVLLVGMNLLWSGTYSIFKVLGANLSSGSIATLRYALAAALLAVAWPWLPGRGPRGRDLARIAVMGTLVFCFAPRLQIEGVHRGQAGDTSLLIALDPLITALAAALFLRERIAPRRWWGFLLGIIGVVLLSNVWHGSQPLRGLLANALFISSFVCETAYSVVGKPLLERIGALKLVAAGLFAGTAANVAMDVLIDGGTAFAAVRSIPLSAWLWLIYLAAVCTVVGFTLWYVVIRETPVNIAGLTIFVQPAAGWLLSVLWLREPMHWGQLWGSMVIVAGLIIGLWQDRRRADPGSQSPTQDQVAAAP